MTANHDTPEAVEAMAAWHGEGKAWPAGVPMPQMHADQATAAMLRRLHKRATDAERERDEARADAAHTAEQLMQDILRARADALREAMPEEVTESMAPQCMGKFDALSWTLGWNSCRLSILALINKEPRHD